MTILVTGSSGTIGSELVKELTKAGQSVRAGYRTRPPTAAGVQGVKIDLTTGEGLEAAVRGADAVFVLAGEMDDQTAAEIRVVEAAKRAGVRRVVKLSVLGAPTEAYSFAKVHRPVERAIEASGIGFTFLRPGSFMQNFVTYEGEGIRREGVISLPCGNARQGFVDVRDIARVAAKVLTSGGHEGKAYDLCGPELLTYGEAAAKLSAALGRTIRYVDVAEGDYRQAMVGMGVPASYVGRLLDLYRFIREGRAAVKSTAVRDVTGREAVSFDQFARDYADALKPQ
jgi:uncharacterized protein YbjT (DUF2867 family)